jgi:hypothetical protein
MNTASKILHECRGSGATSFRRSLALRDHLGSAPFLEQTSVRQGFVQVAQ